MIREYFIYCQYVLLIVYRQQIENKRFVKMYEIAAIYGGKQLFHCVINSRKTTSKTAILGKIRLIKHMINLS